MGGGAQEAGQHTCENQLPNQVRTYVSVFLVGCRGNGCVQYCMYYVCT